MAEPDLYRQLFDDSPEAFIVIDAGGAVVRANERAGQLAGVPAAELTGRPLTSVLPGALTVGEAGRLQTARSDGQPLAIELRRRRSGPYTMLWLSEAGPGAEALGRALRAQESALAELRHRIKNDLQILVSLLNLQARRAPDAASQRIVRELQARVRVLALYHEREERARNDFGAYLRALVEQLKPHDGRVALTLTVDAQPVALAGNQAVPLGIIVSELIGNALQHAFPDVTARGRIEVQLQRVERELRLSVRDDGVGLPATLDPAEPRTLGLQIVTALVDQLGAALDWTRQGGTGVTLRLPLGGGA